MLHVSAELAPFSPLSVWQRSIGVELVDVELSANEQLQEETSSAPPWKARLIGDLAVRT